jgi:hypothetical protein
MVDVTIVQLEKCVNWGRVSVTTTALASGPLFVTVIG